MNALESHLFRQIEHSREFFWHRLRWQALSYQLPPDRPFELADVGAGAGLLGDFLRRRFPAASYRFVEPISSLERHLESAYGEASNLRARPSFRGVEFVTLMDVLEHQVDDRTFLMELVNKMEPSATLIVTVPALMSLWSPWDVALGHFRRYDKKSFRSRLEGLPVEIRELSYLFPEMIPLGWVRRLLRRPRRPKPDRGPAEFPDLPRTFNHVLYGVGTVSLRLRHFWPAGTSLLAVLVRR